MGNNWSHLNHLQLGRYAEYLVKMEFTLHGLDVYSAEVDDKGIDLVIRKEEQKEPRYYDVQVKSCRGLNYIFFPKDKFDLRENLLAAVVIFLEDEAPKHYLIPSEAWRQEDALLRNKNYKGLKSKLEWGLNLSMRNLPLLERFRFEDQMRLL